MQQPSATLDNLGLTFSLIFMVSLIKFTKNLHFQVVGVDSRSVSFSQKSKGSKQIRIRRKNQSSNKQKLKSNFQWKTLEIHTIFTLKQDFLDSALLNCIFQHFFTIKTQFFMNYSHISRKNYKYLQRRRMN